MADTTAKIVATFWGEDACNKCNFSAGDIVAIKGAKVSDFNGKSLNASGKNLQIFTLKKDQKVLEKVPEVEALKKWTQSGTYDD